MNEFGEVLERVSLKSFNTYGIGGIARYLIKADIQKLGELIKYLKKNNIKYYILGNGSNVILPDEDFDGAIILLKNKSDIKIDGNIVRVSSSTNLGELVKATLDKGFVNLAFLYGIPGTLGGAIVCNAGAYNNDIFEYVESVTILDEEDNIVTINKGDINYSYRNTEFKKRNVVILYASLKLEVGNTEEANKIIQENLKKRQASQPLQFKNAGSVFKNPSGYSAGALIDKLGLKGKSIGGAKISEKHANFIINFNNATSHDIIELIKYVQLNVKNNYNIDLELEQIIVKW